MKIGGRNKVLYQNALADRQCLGTKLEPRLLAFITNLTLPRTWTATRTAKKQMVYISKTTTTVFIQLTALGAY